MSGVFALLLLAGGCKRWSDPTKLQDDLDRMCKVATVMEKDRGGDHDRLRELGRRIVSEKVGPLGAALVKLALETPPNLRRRVVNGYLERNGVEGGVDCPPLERVLFAEK